MDDYRFFLECVQNARELATAFPGSQFLITSGTPILIARNERYTPRIVVVRATNAVAGVQTVLYLARRSEDLGTGAQTAQTGQEIQTIVVPSSSPMVTVKAVFLLRYNQDLYADGSLDGTNIWVVSFDPTDIRSLVDGTKPGKKR